MTQDEDIAELAKRFEALGARDPEGWASSQIREGLPQLGRYLFLRQAWAMILPEGNPSWIRAWISSAEREPEAPYAGGGLALKRLKAIGATDEELTDLVRAFQAELLFGFCYLLNDPGIHEPEARDVAWRLFELGPNDEILRPIDSLHESVLETDPTGREMRPRP